MNEVEKSVKVTTQGRNKMVLRQFWGIILTGTIRPSGEAVQSLPSRTFVV